MVVCYKCNQHLLLKFARLYTYVNITFVNSLLIFNKCNLQKRFAQQSKIPCIIRIKILNYYYQHIANQIFTILN